MGHNYCVPLAAHHDAPHIKIDKGVYKRSCNRRACQGENAVWWNRGSSMYYCKRCAHLLNRANPPGEDLERIGITDSLLCVEMSSPYHPYHEDPDAVWLKIKELYTATDNLFDDDKTIDVADACKKIIVWRKDRYAPDFLLSHVQDRLNMIRKIRK